MAFADREAGETESRQSTLGITRLGEEVLVPMRGLLGFRPDIFLSTGG